MTESLSAQHCTAPVKMANFWKCMFGPQLNQIHRLAEAESRQYSPNVIEFCSNGVLRSLKFVWSIGLYSTPLIISVLYKKDYFTRNKLFYLLKYSFFFGIVFMGSFFIRGIGRYANSDYTSFLKVLNDAKSNFCHDTKKELARYDFSFWAWPVEFDASVVDGEPKKPLQITSRPSKRSTIFESIKALPCQMLSYFVAHTIGRRLLYPGSLQLLQATMDQMLVKGRLRLVKKYNGERFKLKTRDGNEIDTMFIDRRRKFEDSNGDILVICCEGNAGFYEMGIMDTPIKANYSVLGWNHPGFAGSTGEPFPNQELNAMDAIMQFSIHSLGYRLENIVLYAWSIGGFTASWAASSYPDIKGLVLDATFDDLVPLAVAQMPQSWKPIVVRTVRDYLNLNNVEQLSKYPGPVILIRRSKDEVITIGDSPSLKNNRGNVLLTKLLQSRYPQIFDEEALALLQQWLASDPNKQSQLWRQYNVGEDLCQTLATTCSADEGRVFPSALGEAAKQEIKFQLVLFLASKHLIDYDSGHCQPLPADLFTLPWNPMQEG